MSGGIAFISHIAAWLIGEYFYVFGYSQHDIHCHKEAPKEKDGKFFFWRHIKVSETEEKNEEVEITTPIMRLTKGGLFKKSTAWCPSHVFPGARNWEIKTLRHGFVELYDITIDLIMKPVAFKDALFLLSNDVVCRFGLWIMLQGYEDRRKEVQSLSSIKCRLTDFGIAVCRLVLDLKDSKEKMRSVIGQKTREALEAGLARLPTADVETWMAVAAKERADEKAKSDKPAAAAA